MTVMKIKDFANLLRELADSIENGDSYEGSLQYTFTEPAQPGMMNVEAALRTGNLDGQGGMILL